MKTRVVVIVGGGSGSRLGANVPKAFVELAGVSLLIRSLQRFVEATFWDGIVLVVPKGYEPETKALLERHAVRAREKVLIVAGGETRHHSVVAGIQAWQSQSVSIDQKSGASVVFAVHDAARCLVSPQQILQVVVAAETAGAAALALPIRDTLKRAGAAQDMSTGGAQSGSSRRVIGGSVALDNAAHLVREHVFAMQTPQCVRGDVLFRALELQPDPRMLTDEVSLVAPVHPVELIEGSYENIKITTAEDLRFATRLIT